MARSVSDTCAPFRLTTMAISQTSTAERTLINTAVCPAAKRHADILQLEYGLGRLLGHIVDGILIAQPIGALDCIIKVILPFVVVHVGECRIYATLGSDRVRSCGKQLSNHSGLETSVGETVCGSQSSATRAYYYGVVRVIDDTVVRFLFLLENKND